MNNNVNSKNENNNNTGKTVLEASLMGLGAMSLLSGCSFSQNGEVSDNDAYHKKNIIINDKAEARKSQEKTNDLKKLLQKPTEKDFVQNTDDKQESNNLFTQEEIALFESIDISNYEGNSIVDALAEYDSSKEFRTKLARYLEIENYDFSAEKNIEMLNKLRYRSVSIPEKKDNQRVYEKYKELGDPIHICEAGKDWYQENNVWQSKCITCGNTLTHTEHCYGEIETNYVDVHSDVLHVKMMSQTCDVCGQKTYLSSLPENHNYSLWEVDANDFQKLIQECDSCEHTRSKDKPKPVEDEQKNEVSSSDSLIKEHIHELVLEKVEYRVFFDKHIKVTRYYCPVCKKLVSHAEVEECKNISDWHTDPANPDREIMICNDCKRVVDTRVHTHDFTEYVETKQKDDGTWVDVYKCSKDNCTKEVAHVCKNISDWHVNPDNENQEIKVCLSCGKIVDTRVHTHDFTEYVETKQKDDGTWVDVYKCSKDNCTKEVAHVCKNISDWHVNPDNENQEIKVCLNCGKIVDTKELHHHDFTEYVETKQKDDGTWVEIYKCPSDGTTKEFPHLNCDWEINAPTYTPKGNGKHDVEYTKTCKKCGKTEVINKEIDQACTDFEWKIDPNDSCNEMQVCKNCGQIAGVRHTQEDYEEKIEYHNDPNDDVNHIKIVYRVYECGKHREVISESRTPHTYSDWERNPEDPTKDMRTCSCKHIEYRDHEEEHVCVEEDIPTVVTQHNVDGHCEVTYTIWHCKECGKEVRKEESIVEHEYTFSTIEFDDVCIHCGKTKTDIENTPIKVEEQEEIKTDTEPSEKIDSTEEKPDSLDEELSEKIDSTEEKPDSLDEELSEEIDSTEEKPDSLEEESSEEIDSTEEEPDSLEEESSEEIDSTEEEPDSLEEESSEEIDSTEEKPDSLEEEPSEEIKSTEEASASLDEELSKLIDSTQEQLNDYDSDYEEDSGLRLVRRR